MADQQQWNEAVRLFDCPWCWRTKGQPCVAFRDDLYQPERDLVKPHENRLHLLAETDPAVKGSFQ